ncbi:hypothetical protein SAMN05421539_102624 [Jannaschia seohaensis]|uniref:Uncharacterized protein n=1 Tax=Jannaschia seohaensis TaxID=475081 RepID=A0A2Y9AFC5_9RHOB|nr:hypothetical protein BCF38_102624 [Jannaschia seohaensis]SSA41978.1 hypothetical protein SAMN05421539_102624 [Jannaschia seohaensis]
MALPCELGFRGVDAEEQEAADIGGCPDRPSGADRSATGFHIVSWVSDCPRRRGVMSESTTTRGSIWRRTGSRWTGGRVGARWAAHANGGAYIWRRIVGMHARQSGGRPVQLPAAGRLCDRTGLAKPSSKSVRDAAELLSLSCGSPRGLELSSVVIDAHAPATVRFVPIGLERVNA